MGSRLLLVNGDTRSRRLLDLGLRTAGFSVDTAGDGTEAWSRLLATPPDLVIADASLEGIDGFALCTRLRQTPTIATIPFIILVGDETLEKKLRSLEAGADDYLVKPAYLQEVVARVRERLKRRQRDRLTFAGQDGQSGQVQGDLFKGDLADITVTDLLQIMEGNARSGIAHLRGDAPTTGSIFFRNGRVVDAEVGRLSGVNALSRLIAWTRGTFDLEWKTIRRKDVVARPAADLIIEGIQRLDEWHRLSESFAEPHAVFEVDYEVLAERLAEIPDDLNEILRLCDGVRTIEQVIEGTVMPDVEGLTALARLRDEGIIYSIANSKRERVPPPIEDPSASWPAANAFSPRASPAPGRRRTAPGLGGATVDESLALSPDASPETSAAGYSAIPEAREEPPHAGGFPAVDETRRRVQLAADAAGSLAPTPPPMDTPGLPPRSMLRTQRGFALSAAAEPSQDNAIPQAVSEPKGDESSAPGSGEHASVQRRDEGGGEWPVQEPQTPPPAAVGPSPPDATPVAVSSVSGSGTVIDRRSQAADATVRISFPDDDISPREALDELGLPSRWRALRFLVVAVLVGGLAAFVVNRFRAGRAGSEPVADRGAPDASAPASSNAVVGAAASEPMGGGVARDAAVDGSDPRAMLPGAAPPQGAPAVGDERGAGGVSPTGTAPAPAPPVPPVPPIPPSRLAGEPRANVPIGLGLDASVAVEATPESTLPLPHSTAPPAGPTSVVAAPSAEAPPPSTEGAATFSRQLADCRTAFTRNHLHEALDLCTAAVAGNPGSAEALTMLAHTELNRGRLSRAADLATRAIAADPNVADAYVIIGGVRQDSGQNAEAKAAYRRYLQLAPHGRYADDLRSIVNSL